MTEPLESLMPPDPHDPFDLYGKNLKRVAPQVRRNIKVQRARVIGHIVTLLVCLSLGIAGSCSTGVLFVFGVGCLVVAPFSLLGIYCDHRLMKWHQQRLAECERRLAEAKR